MEVSLDRIVANYLAVQRAVSPRVTVMPVLKGDAYGHGIAAVGRALSGAGATWLAVAHVDEAVLLRESGVPGRVLVLNVFERADLQAALDYGATPVVHSPDGLDLLNQLARAANARVRYHLKIDTGLHRFGATLDPRALVAHVRKARAAVLEGLMTHLAAGADFESTQTDLQLARFEAYERVFRAEGYCPPYTHAAATTAIAYGRSPAWRNMVRPGDAIYGYVAPRKGAGPENCLPLRPALSWKTRIVEVKWVAAGEAVGYGATAVRTTAPRRIALIGMGYADGLSPRIAGGGCAICHGALVPFLASVSMNTAILDVTDHPAVQRGDVAILIGSEQGASLSAADINRIAGGNTSSILTAINPRTPRLYTSGDAASLGDESHAAMRSSATEAAWQPSPVETLSGPRLRPLPQDAPFQASIHGGRSDGHRTSS